MFARPLHPKNLVRGAAAALLVALALTPVASSPVTRRFESKITAIDGKTPDFFGRSVDLDGTTLVVGAFGEASGGKMSGATYVYEYAAAKNDWTQVAKLFSQDRAELAKFGSSVALDGSRFVVGATGADGNRGAAYVFAKGPAGDWQQVARLRGSNRGPEANFGSAVALRGPLAVIGAPASRDADGAVHVFTGTSSSHDWKEISRLAPDPSIGARRFGSDVALGPNTLVVGAEGDDRNPGQVFVYRWSTSGWSAEAVLRPNDTQPGDRFGGSIAFEGSTLVIGAYGAQQQAGAVYVFERSGDGWHQAARLTAPNGFSGDLFGRRVDLSGSALVVGAEGSGAGTGSMFVFGKSGAGWSYFTQVTPGDGEPGDQFAGALATSGPLVAAGASTDNGGKGGVYVYDFTPPG